MSTYGSVAAVDVPPGIDIRAACRAMMQAQAGDEYVAEPADDWHRHLMMFGGIELLPQLEELLRTAGTARLALSEDYDEYGSLWVVLAAQDGHIRTVHRRYVLNADPADATEVAQAVAVLRADPHTGDIALPDPRDSDVTGADAAAEAAALFAVAPEAMLAAEEAADETFEILGVVGALPWWDALGIPWQGDCPDLDYDDEAP